MASASMPRTLDLATCKVRRRRIDGRLFDRDCDLKRLLVQFDQKVSLVHPVVVVDEDARDLAFDAGGDERHVTVDVGVVGRNRVERRLDPGNAEPKGGRQDHDARCSKQHFSPPAGLWLLGQDRPCAGRVLWGWRRIRRCESKPACCPVPSARCSARSWQIPVIERMNDNPA